MSLFKTQDIDSLKKEFPRVEQAAQNTQQYWEKTLNEKGLTIPLDQIFIQSFKEEKKIEIWGRNQGEFQLVKTYPICFVPGKIGPKIRQGDKQVPEGWYQIDSINPKSDFHLSLRINYPNAADSIRSRNEKDAGGDIFIHGDCYSVGCIPIEDEPIEELFWLIVQSLYANREQAIYVLSLPFDVLNEEKYTFYSEKHPEHLHLWEQLKSIQMYFKEFGMTPEIEVDENGEYQIQY